MIPSINYSELPRKPRFHKKSVGVFQTRMIFAPEPSEEVDLYGHFNHNKKTSEEVKSFGYGYKNVLIHIKNPSNAGVFYAKSEIVVLNKQVSHLVSFKPTVVNARNSAS